MLFLLLSVTRDPDGTGSTRRLTVHSVASVGKFVTVGQISISFHAPNDHHSMSRYDMHLNGVIVKLSLLLPGISALRIWRIRYDVIALENFFMTFSVRFV